MKDFSSIAKRRLILGLLVISTVFLCFEVSAKRGPRPVVAPIRLNDVEFRAPNTIATEGCVEAWDIKTGMLLWRKRLYYSIRLPFAEEDSQWNFISSMTLDSSGDSLRVVNEAGERFVVKINFDKGPRNVLVNLLLVISCGTGVILFLSLRRRARKRH